MLKDILNLKGAHKLDKIALKNVNGSAFGNPDCTCDMIRHYHWCFLEDCD